MRGYGRDYDDRNWIERAGETVRGWFGGGRDYDRDYGDRDMGGRDWSRGDWGTGMRGGTYDRGERNWGDRDSWGETRESWAGGGWGNDVDYGRGGSRGYTGGGGTYGGHQGGYGG